MLAYALCRDLEGYDEIVVDKMTTAIAQDGHRMQSLVIAVVTKAIHLPIGASPTNPAQFYAK